MLAILKMIRVRCSLRQSKPIVVRTSLATEWLSVGVLFASPGLGIARLRRSEQTRAPTGADDFWDWCEWARIENSIELHRLEITWANGGVSLSGMRIKIAGPSARLFGMEITSTLRALGA